MRGRLARWLRRLGLAAVALVATLLVIVAITAKPGDPALYPAHGPETRTIHLVSHGWHSGLVIPRAALADSGTALRAVAIRFRDYPLLEFGWGEARFYRATPTVADLDWRLGLEALFTPGGREGVVQVVGLSDDVRAAFPYAEIVAVTLSPEGLARLLARLDASFHLEDHRPRDEGPGLYGPSLFYAGEGRFSYANVCNHWSAGLLNAAGVPVSPVLATFPAGLILDLEWRSGARLLPRPAITPPA